MTAPSPGGARLPFRNSLQLRLPLGMALLVVLALSIFLWLAFREVERSLIQVGGERAQAAADQVASLFERPATQTPEATRALAADETVVRYAHDPTDQTRESVGRRFASLKSTSARRVEIWSRDGVRLLSVALPGSAQSSPGVLPENTAAPKTAGIGPLQTADSTTVFTDTAAEILAHPSEPGRAQPLGWLVLRATFNISPPSILRQLVGRDAIVKLGNRDGGVWTDLERAVVGPPVDVSVRGVREYDTPDGAKRIGAAAPVRHSPWAVWVEFPREMIVAPANQFLTRMVALALASALVAAIVVGVVTARITTPLRALAGAATEIAGGDYSRRVAPRRSDETGHLAEAFNTMAGKIQGAYDALKENYDQTQFALGAAHMGIWEIDLATNRVTCLDACAQVFGLNQATAPRETAAFFDLVHPDDRAMARMALATAIEHRRDEYSVTFRVLWPDRSSLRWVDSRARILYGENGTAVRVLGVVIDVTPRMTLEHQLRQSQKLEAVGQLAGGVAHDFNNLLTAILGFSSLLSDDLGPDHPLRRPVAEITKAGERGAGLTRQLLAFSRRQVLEPTIVNLNTLVTETSAMLRRLIGEHIRLSTKLAPDIGMVLADRTQLEQVVINLALNARDAMPGGGTLAIETAQVGLDETHALEHVVVRPGHYVMLAVSDTGVGMDEDTRRRVFEPFFTTKERGRGTGLGLATVYGIVKQSGGYVWVYSEKDHGAAFKVYLPRVRESEEAVRLPAHVPTRSGGSETVLIVEDDDGIRLLSFEVLTKAGYRVLEAPNPEVAAEIFSDEVDLILSDVIMPGSSGPALYETLAARKPTLKVLYMSGYTDDMIVHEGRLEPGTAYLQKPFNPDTLRRKVREVLDA